MTVAVAVVAAVSPAATFQSLKGVTSIQVKKRSTLQAALQDNDIFRGRQSP
jgi:hypothetical protein